MDRSSLIATAAATTGLDTDAIDASLAEVTEPLELLLDSLDADAALTDAGQEFTGRWLARLIGGRAQLQEWTAQDPGVADETIAAPVIVAGAPRTGTTYLHGLLAQHPQLRAPEGWELLFPVPPPEATTADDEPRILAADEELTWPQRQRESMMSIHRYAGRMHKECLSAMSFSFRSEEFVSRYRVPRYVEWLGACDMAPAYDMHRLVLQTLQRRRTTRWVLKSPVHLNNLTTVLATYPDARVVITHRDPAEILGSVTSLVANLRRAFSDEVDEVEIARYHMDLYGRTLDSLARDAPDEGGAGAQLIHIDQRALIAEPQAVMDDLLVRLDLGPSTVDTAPPAEAGRHDYALVGVDPAEIDAVFAGYRHRFLGDER
ncbi:MAG: sulfotransferase [Acidimicrobiales bacterium]